ncbi:uncharacterized protein LOC128302949 [Anopheles moucheti]|uniref:uncharacterized protein LOC128302949 n=1 Tax=Anopheles moucheti TaxID=186751 RepID=UPI0022F057A1|nr:uncharacterized protein LOC128302949 [Anopheles moucheti]
MSVASTCLSVNMEEQLKLVEDERRLRVREIEEKREMKRRENAELARRLDEKKKLAEEESILRERELKTEEEMRVLEQSVLREALEKKRELMLQGSRTSRMGSECSYSEKIMCWLNGSKGMTGAKSMPNKDIPYSSGSTVSSVKPIATSSATKREKEMVGARQEEEVYDAPSRRQVAARQVLGKDVPHFNGNPEDWPIFISMFEESTKTCGAKTIYAFVDEGSSFSLIDESVARELNVYGSKSPLTLQWTGQVTRSEPNSERVQLQISGEDKTSKFRLENVRTVSSLLQPSQTLNYGVLKRRFPHLAGLPIKNYESVQPQLLIGLDNIRLGVPLKLREGRSTEPIAAMCRLGWSIYGGNGGGTAQTPVVNFHVAPATDSDFALNEQLRDYFTMEDFGTSIPRGILDSEEEKRSKRLLEETTRRVEPGNHFETGLLWNTDCPNFPDSYTMAVKRMESLERKFIQMPNLEAKVHETIADYEAKGYAHKATLEELSCVEAGRIWYLPLGVVHNPKKPNKIRLIWDAAAKVAGVSFNSRMLKGPDLLTPLPQVLSHFRQHPVAVAGDIMEMFHQIRIRDPDRQSQRFVYRKKPGDPVEVYVMDVATFGSACSPASAQYVKNKNAMEHAKEFPRATEAIIRNHYVDDYLQSFTTVEEAIEVVKEVKLVHSKGGFTLRRFLSNSSDVLKSVGDPAEETTKNLMIERGEDTGSVLGMKWKIEEDVFVFSFATNENIRHIIREEHVPTKREVLKVVMSLFDPMGLVSFFLVHGKILIQEIWMKGIGWDEEIPADLYKRWREWTDLFPRLDGIHVPRCYFKSPHPNCLETLQLHVFVDASETAYSAVAYFRVETKGVIQSSRASDRPDTIQHLEKTAKIKRVRSPIYTQSETQIQRLVPSEVSARKWGNSSERDTTTL